MLCLGPSKIDTDQTKHCVFTMISGVYLAYSWISATV